MDFENLSTRTTGCGVKFSTILDAVYGLSTNILITKKCRKNLSTYEVEDQNE